MKSGRGFQGSAQELRAETRGLIRLHIGAICAAFLALGFTGSAFFYAHLFGEGEPGFLALCFSWISLALVLAATISGWMNSWREQKVERLVRENLLLNYPENRKDLEAWLSRELVGSKAALVRELLERRLDRRLAKTKWIPLAKSHYLAMLLVIIAFLVLASFHLVKGLSPWKGIDHYMQGFLAGNAEEPPLIIDISPSRRWIQANALESLEIAFDRDLDRPGEILLADSTSRIPLDSLGEKRYRARIPEARGRVSFQIAVGSWKSQEFEYQIYPARPVEVAEVQLFGALGNGLETFSGGRSPVSIPEGAVVRFELRVSPCPLSSFGLGGGRLRGELKLKKAGEGVFHAEARILQDESFWPFWQFPGEAAQLGPEISFQVSVSPAPVVKLLSPADGACLKRYVLPIALQGKCRGDRARGFLLFSDYLDMKRVFEFDVKSGKGDDWDIEFPFPLDLLNANWGRVLGVCAALQTNSGVPKTGYSQVINVILPEKPPEVPQGEQRNEEKTVAMMLRETKDFSGESPFREIRLEDWMAGQGVSEGTGDSRGESSDPLDPSDGSDASNGDESDSSSLAEGKKSPGYCPHCGGT